MENNEEKIEVSEAELKYAVGDIMDYCQGKGMSQLVAYMAMKSITNTMEENLGFGCERKADC